MAVLAENAKDLQLKYEQEWGIQININKTKAQSHKMINIKFGYLLIIIDSQGKQEINLELNRYKKIQERTMH